MTRAEELAAALQHVESRLTAACTAAGRARDEVTLVAVSKTWPATDVAQLAALGVRDFGENTDQEARGKLAAARDVNWHFVGRLQTNKCRSVASYAELVHSADRRRVITALGQGAERAGRSVSVCVQVSLDGSAARGGALPTDVPELAEQLAGTPGLRLAGLMAVAPAAAEPAEAFARLFDIAQRLRRDHPTARVISAGMSGDLEPAIAAGATHVRVGTALFGGRPPLVG